MPVRIPWRGPSRPYDWSSNIPQLMLRQGEIQAQQAARSGEIWGNAIQNVGNIAAGAVQQYGEQKAATKKQQAMAARDSAFVSTIETWDGKDPKALLTGLTKVLGPTEGLKATQAVVSFVKPAEDPKQELANFGTVLDFASKQSDEVMGRFYPALRQRYSGVLKQIGLSAEALPESWSPELRKPLTDLAGALSGRKPAGLTEVSPGASLYDPEKGAAVYTAPKPTEPTKAPEPRVVGRSLISPEGRLIYRDPEAAKETKREWVVRDGKPVRVSEGEIRPGDEPYNSPKTSLKNVISGQAEELSDFDTSMDDLKVIRERLAKPGSTGAVAQAGAALPAWVTSITGWGEDAKSRQAVIDRVKQVIGKTLEGGVLRKEDELKYEKILPTIKDSAGVVKSKLDGLEAAVAQRKQRRLDSLEDAGFDVSRYRKREGAAKGSFDPADSYGYSEGTVIEGPDGELVLRGGRWVKP